MVPPQASMLPARTRVAVKSAPASAAAARPSVERHGPLSQALFRDALLRERKRADRFEEPFALVLISLNRYGTRHGSWGTLVEALTSSGLDADVIGWFAQDAVLGLVRSLSDRDSKETPAALAASVRRELMGSLARDKVAGCSIRLEVYSPHGDATPSVVPSVVFDAGDRRRTPRDRVRDASKRLLDILGSAAFLIAFSPLFLLVSALVKLTSKGPVFFRQERVGAGGGPFMMLKFRTMHVNADPKIHQQYVENFIRCSEIPQADKNVVFKIVDDPRVTRIGHFLRRSSLDELPQFWNVFKGQMSLVGPRPPLPYEVARYKTWHRRRLFEAKPGITGLWQVTGRSRTTFDEMVRLDIRYAASYSLWADIKILLATPRVVLLGKGAH